jgi:hypothetical protein
MERQDSPLLHTILWYPNYRALFAPEPQFRISCSIKHLQRFTVLLGNSPRWLSCGVTISILIAKSSPGTYRWALLGHIWSYINPHYLLIKERVRRRRDCLLRITSYELCFLLGVGVGFWAVDGGPPAAERRRTVEQWISRAGWVCLVIVFVVVLLQSRCIWGWVTQETH